MGFGPLGFYELMFILVLALLIFGPKKLPEIGRTIGRGMSELRRATTDLKRSVEEEVEAEERRAKLPQPLPKPTVAPSLESASAPRDP
jgi:TatA/E family protein of Tat protein translocase